MCGTNSNDRLQDLASVLGAGNPVNLAAALFNKNVIDGMFYFFEKLDESEKKRRYDDNNRLLLVQALRLFEKGQITKDQLKAIIDNALPDTKTVNAVRLPNLPQRSMEVDGQALDLEAILRKLEN